MANGRLPSAIRYPPSAMLYPATWLILAVVTIIVLVFWLGWYWAKTHGQFDDVEAAKYAMLENERRYGDERYLSAR
jgi:nitrogen fixation-related uncharacterized protein